MVFRVRVSAPRRDNMDNPAQGARGSNPGNARYKQPDDSNQDPPVINLTHSRNQKTQNACKHWIAHREIPSARSITTRWIVCSMNSDYCAGVASTATGRLNSAGAMGGADCISKARS